MRYKYSKFTGEELEGIDLDELFSKLSDLLLFSGFEDGQAPRDDDRTLQALHDAILDALLTGDLLPEDTLERLLTEGADPQRLEELVQALIDRLNQAGYVTTSPGSRGGARSAPGRHRERGG